MNIFCLISHKMPKVVFIEKISGKERFVFYVAADENSYYDAIADFYYYKFLQGLDDSKMTMEEYFKAKRPDMAAAIDALPKPVDFKNLLFSRVIMEQTVHIVKTSESSTCPGCTNDSLGLDDHMECPFGCAHDAKSCEFCSAEN